MFFRRRAEPDVIQLSEPDPVAIPSVIQVSMADKAAEIVTIESIKTVFLRVAMPPTPAVTIDVEATYAAFREHLKQHGYHLEIFI